MQKCDWPLYDDPFNEHFYIYSCQILRARPKFFWFNYVFVCLNSISYRWWFTAPNWKREANVDCLVPLVARSFVRSFCSAAASSGATTETIYLSIRSLQISASRREVALVDGTTSAIASRLHWTDDPFRDLLVSLVTKTIIQGEYCLYFWFQLKKLRSVNSSERTFFMKKSELVHFVLLSVSRCAMINANQLRQTPWICVQSETFTRIHCSITWTKNRFMFYRLISWCVDVLHGLNEHFVVRVKSSVHWMLYEWL